MKLISRYIIVGVWNSVFGVSNFILLSSIFRLTPDVIVLAISYGVSIIQAHFTQRNFVWNSKAPYLPELLKFSSIYLLQFLVNIVLLVLSEEFLSFSREVRQMLIFLLLTPLFYIINKKGVFKLVKDGNQVDQSWKKRACPLCDSSEISSKPQIFAKRRAEKMNWDEAKKYFIGLRNNQVFFSYFRCKNCDLLYCPWYFTRDQIALLYSEMPDNKMGNEKSIVSKTQAGYAKRIIQGNVRSDVYLEIGPDIGLVSKEIIELKKPSRISFVEPNLSVRKELLKNSIDVGSIDVVDHVENLQYTDFTLIVGVHVYDHLLDPIQDLKYVHGRSSANAHLSIVVHNEKSLLRKILKANWPPFCLQHPQLYNPKTLSKLLEKSGWTARKIEKSTNWYHLKYFVGMGFSVLGIKDRFSRYLPNIEFPIRLGNLICLAEKKESI